MTDGTTNFGGKLYISGAGSTPQVQNSDLDLAGFQAIADWIQLPNVGNIGPTGVSQNLVNYPTWDRRVLQKGKGQANAGDPEVEVLDVPSNGMTAFKAAAGVSNMNRYAFKIEWDDGSREFNRGLVTGPTLPKGGNEEFKRAAFSLGLVQEPEFDEVTV